MFHVRAPAKDILQLAQAAVEEVIGSPQGLHVTLDRESAHMLVRVHAPIEQRHAIGALLAQRVPMTITFTVQGYQP